MMLCAIVGLLLLLIGTGASPAQVCTSTAPTSAVLGAERAL
jgi:hypothetical protein